MYLDKEWESVTKLRCLPQEAEWQTGEKDNRFPALRHKISFSLKGRENFPLISFLDKHSATKFLLQVIRNSQKLRLTEQNSNSKGFL